ncbi:uncharacterized protein BDW43DRAFT_304583 [Aspergillus alliaceus]|uniref:uncharacterized protein n=1 Tax=Petromyces alliaceus TaxID=209559 RepID=UPI0012A4A354|nr:uncharacterized protein BDW43DRAFT_304583 [Aspergillus alliaceus]KAB8227480.1 hypothetical protein BDW43DRAFT_304583 [Aspergillus alliaceus]
MAGRTGLLEWFFLLAFCTLRIVGGSMAIGSGSLAAEIISSVGISPLLLTVDGFLRTLRDPGLNRRVQWLFMAVMHILAVTGVAIVAAEAGGLASRDPSLNDLSLLQTGMALLTAAWVILLTWALCALLQGQSHTFIGIRKAQLNPVTGSLVIRVLLSSLPELIATLIFILVGFQTLTFNIHRQGLQ